LVFYDLLAAALRTGFRHVLPRHVVRPAQPDQADAERVRQWGSALQMQGLAPGHRVLNETMRQPGEANAAMDVFLQAQGLP
jgi:hypothetical protein